MGSAFPSGDSCRMMRADAPVRRTVERIHSVLTTYSGGDHVTTHDPHKAQPVLRQGPELSAARLAAILVHGRGATAANILELAREVNAADIAFLAPQAAG